MQLPARPCPKPGCPVLNCTEHSNARDHDRERRDSHDRQVYQSTRWRRLRTMVLARDPVCQVCHLEVSTDADHVLPIAAGGDAWSLDNLQGLCGKCHRRKTNSEKDSLVFRRVN